MKNEEAPAPKKEEPDVNNEDIKMDIVKDEDEAGRASTPPAARIPPPFAVFQSADEIDYVPESAFTEGLSMVSPVAISYMCHYELTVIICARSNKSRPISRLFT